MKGSCHLNSQATKLCEGHPLRSLVINDSQSRSLFKMIPTTKFIQPYKDDLNIEWKVKFLKGSILTLLI